MKRKELYNDTIRKPSKPHRTVHESEIPTAEDIKKRITQLKKLKMLGISTNTLDNTDDTIEYEEDLDKLNASILIMQDKELPKELEQRILRKNRMKKDKSGIIRQKHSARKPITVKK